MNLFNDEQLNWGWVDVFQPGFALNGLLCRFGLGLRLGLRLGMARLNWPGDLPDWHKLDNFVAALAEMHDDNISISKIQFFL